MKYTKIILSMTIYLAALTGMNAQNYQPVDRLQDTAVHTQSEAGYNTFRLGWHWGWAPRLTAVLKMNQSHCKDYIEIGTNNAI